MPGLPMMKVASRTGTGRTKPGRRQCCGPVGERAAMHGIDLGLEGRRVLVTGASRGIGAAAARAFAAAGCRLALHHHTEPFETAAISGAVRLEGDFALMGDVRRVVGE